MVTLRVPLRRFMFEQLQEVRHAHLLQVTAEVAALSHDRGSSVRQGVHALGDTLGVEARELVRGQIGLLVDQQETRHEAERGARLEALVQAAVVKLVGDQDNVRAVVSAAIERAFQAIRECDLEAARAQLGSERAEHVDVRFDQKDEA